jgi:hypothetical protein
MYFKKAYRPKTNLIKGKDYDMLVNYYNILNTVVELLLRHIKCTSS